MEKRITEEICRTLEQHGYRSPVLLGEGSFSVVYRVCDQKSRFWACKISEAGGQWERECHNSKEICHPRFPTYREHWTEGGKGYLVMEFWDGCDLRKMLGRRGRLSPEQAGRIALQISEGLQYLHERPYPFLYRDLKPENIRIRVDGSAGILDLGCLWNREQEWSGAGNRSYSAPEQFVQGEIPGEESDVYAVGKILAAMLGEEADEVKRGQKGSARQNKSKKTGRKQRRQENWLRKISAIATCGERKDRIPDIKTLRTLLAVSDASGRERRRAYRAADFYYIRKLYCP